VVVGGGGRKGVSKKEAIKKMEERKWIEHSDIYQLLLWYAWRIGGGLKFVDLEKDIKFVRKSDHLVYLGRMGEFKAMYLSKVLNYTSNVVGLEEILEMVK
jgi:hypothetical protein